MPIPSAPIGRGDVASTVLVLLGQLHDQVRQEIEGLDDVGLNWSPGPGTNSIATTVVHMVGSEAETVRCVAGVPVVRDREGEFRGGRQSRDDVLRQLRMADELIAELHGAIGMHHLRRRVTLPTLPAAERRSGLTWLVGVYGHGREHVGHIQLTKQLFQATTPADSTHPRTDESRSTPIDQD